MPARLRVARLSLLWLPALTLSIAAPAAAASAPAPPAPGSTVTFQVNDQTDRNDRNVTDWACRSDAGTCTLRAAIEQADTLAYHGVATVVRVPPGVYRLALEAGQQGSGNELVVETRDDRGVFVPSPPYGEPHVDILGAGARTTSIDANFTGRVMSYAAHGLIQDLTFENGTYGGLGAGAGPNQRVVVNRVALVNNSFPELAPGSGGRFWQARIVGVTATGNRGGTALQIIRSDLVNSTVAGNYDGGVSGGAASILSSTIAGNHGRHELDASSGPTLVENSIIGGAGTTRACVRQWPANGVLSSGDFNLVSDASCPFAKGTDVVAKPKLGPLGDHGGQTDTLVPQAGSPAIDTGRPKCPAFDQRGVARPQDGNHDGTARCDRGAVEQ
jgi:hypothetical protein